jgi:GNAT superfamily N-acetyltransferase
VRMVPLTVELIGPVKDLLRLGEPYIGLRTDSDYWLYASLFSSTCPVLLDDDGSVIGIVIAFRSQDDPDDVYVQDVMVHPSHRGRGAAADLLREVARIAAGWGCRRLYLTSEPENEAAARAWGKLGFVNVPGDLVEHGVQVIKDFKGPGKHRAVYELPLAHTHAE